MTAPKYLPVVWMDTYKKITSMTIEELPEYLVHEDRLLRAKARVRLRDLLREESRVVT